MRSQNQPPITRTTNENNKTIKIVKNAMPTVHVAGF